MIEPPDDTESATVEGEDDGPPPLINTPFKRRTPPPALPQEPPPLPPDDSPTAALTAALARWIGQPRRLPFWWHLTTRASEIAHWNRGKPDFQAVPLDFYDRVKKSLQHHAIPQLKTSHVLWKEAGLLSADRLYMRVSWNRYVGDLCAAPFGKTFFFSFWVFVLPPVLSLFHIAGIMTTVISAWLALGQISSAGTFRPGAFSGDGRRAELSVWAELAAQYHLAELALFAVPLLIVLILLWIRYSRRATNEDPAADFLLGMTIIGPIIDVIFRPLTYFQRDTAEMFLGLINIVFFDAVNATMEAGGQRPFTELEMKPKLAKSLGLKRSKR